ncbi:MAG: hypothetical protein U0T32_01240 [Chitinophagales bacterium]
MQVPLKHRCSGAKQTTYGVLLSETAQQAIASFNNKCEITRFKGLWGEISPEEFGGFIGEDIRLSPVIITNDDNDLKSILDYYMGKTRKSVTFHHRQFTYRKRRCRVGSRNGISINELENRANGEYEFTRRRG